MIKVTGIKLLKQEQAVIEIEQNQQKVPHITTLHLILRYHLEEGMSLTKDEYQRFIKDNELELLYQRAIQFISYQMRTISEVKKHLFKHTKDESIINKIIQKLKDQQYLSDSSYVHEYVSEKLEYDTVGPRYIKDKLIQKGIHFDLIDAELLRYHEELEFSKVTELIEKDIRYPQKKPYRKVIDSMKRRYVTKGFQLHIIDSAILAKQEQIMDQIDEDQLIEHDVQKLLKQYDITEYEDKQKVKQKLMQKGYSYPTIQKYLD